MSGELEIAIDVINILYEGIKAKLKGSKEKRKNLKESIYKLQQEEEKLNKSYEQLGISASELNNQRNKNEGLLKEIERETDHIVKQLDILRKEEKTAFIKFKEESIEFIKNFIEEITNIADEEIIKEKDKVIDLIDKSDDKLEIIKLYTEFKVKVENIINKIIKREEEVLQLYKNFGIESEKDLEDEGKIAMVTMFEQLESMGYNPVYDYEENKIIVEKENGDQIVALPKEKGLKLQFHDYQGKNCVKDMRNIEKNLKENGIIDSDARIYTNWYTNEEKENNKKLVLKNKKIYEEYNKKIKKNFQNRI